MALSMFASKAHRRPAGQVDRGPTRELRSDHPRPRPHHLPRDRRQRATARSPASGSRRSPTSAAASRRSARASRPRSTPASCAGCYKIPNVYAEVTGVYTNTTFVDAYRGAGRPEATYVIERAMDLFAAEIGMDRAELRRRNFIQPDQFPYENPSGLGTASGGAKIYIDSGNYEPAMDKALATAGYADLDAKKAEAKARGKLLGMGFSHVHRGLRRRALEVDRRGRRGLGRRDVGVVQHQGPPDRQGRRHDGHPAAGPGPRDDVRPDHQPRARHPDGGRHRPALGHAGHAVRLRLVRQPDLVGRHARRRSRRPTRSRTRPAATRRTCSRPRPRTSRSTAPTTRSRARPTRSRPSRRSPSRSTSRSMHPKGMEPYLDETAYYDTPNCTWPFGTHIAVVEIDEETGSVELVRYVAVDDVGNKINPMIVDGQLHGGIAQGVGQALWEGAIYSDEGQLLTGSMLDYAMPRASMFPQFELGETVTPSPVNPLGVKGVGEAGAIASTAAVANAVIDALSPFGHPTPRHAVHGPDGLASHPGRRREARHDPGRVRVSPGVVARRRARGHLAAGGGAKVLAGGQSLLPLMKLRLAQRRDRSSTSDGSTSSRASDRRPTAAGDRRAHDLRRGPRLDRRSSSPSRRSRTSATSRSATAGRSVGPSPTPIPPRDLPALGLALDYSVVLRSQPRRARRAARRLLRGRVPDRHRLRRAPRRDPPRAAAGGRRAAYQKLTQPGVRVLDRRRGRGRREERRHGQPRPGRASPGWVRSPTAPRPSKRRSPGSDGSAAAIAAAAAHATDGVTVNSDIHADSGYRTAMAEVYTRRALEAALGRSA